MPPLPAVPNVLKVQIMGTSGEATPLNWANILHFSYSGTAPTNTVCNTIATEIATLWNSHMAAECVNNVVLGNVAVTDLTSSTAGSGAAAVDMPGTRGDDELPANVAYLVTYPMSRRYRGGHPRTYLYVLGISDFLDAAHWSDAATTEVIDHWALFLNGIVGYSTSGCTISNLVNVSYVDKALNPVPPYWRTDPIVDTLSTATMIGQQQMASQRRRIGRHRR